MPVPAQMGVEEIYLGKKQKFITVASHLDSAEPIWFGRERKKEKAGREAPAGFASSVEVAQAAGDQALRGERVLGAGLAPLAAPPRPRPMLLARAEREAA